MPAYGSAFWIWIQNLKTTRYWGDTDSSPYLGLRGIMQKLGSGKLKIEKIGREIGITLNIDTFRKKVPRIVMDGFMP
jgi:hypothetical protein